MLRALVVLAIFIVPLGGAVALEDEGGVLFLTAFPVKDVSSATCPLQQAYAMQVPPEVHETDAAVTGDSIPRRTCPTRFHYPASTTFTLGPTANVILHVRCDPASLGEPQATGGNRLGIRLTSDPDAPYGTPASPENGTVEVMMEGPLCTGEPTRIEAEVPAGFTVHQGRTLTLSLWFRYVNLDSENAPLVFVVTGGQDASRIEADGLPSSANERTPIVDLVQRTWYWTAEGRPGEPLAEIDVDCKPLGTPTYRMQYEVAEPGFVAAPVTTAYVACPVAFRLESPGPFVLDGVVTARFFVRCGEATFGEGAFRMRILVDGQEVAAPAQRGITGDIGFCANAPVEIDVSTNLDHPVDVDAGAIVEVRIAAHRLAAPGTETEVAYMVGPEYPSALEVVGPAEAPVPKETETPLPVTMVVLALVLAAARFRP